MWKMKKRKNTEIKSDAETSGRFGTTVSGRFCIKDYRKVIEDSEKSDVAGSNGFGMIWQAQLGGLGQIQHDGLREKRGGFNYFGTTNF